jgi:hypothetical protein
MHSLKNFNYWVEADFSHQHGESFGQPPAVPTKTCAESGAHGYTCSVVGSAHLPKAEHRRRRNLGLCSHCGEWGHFFPTYPLSTNKQGGDKPGNSPAPTQVGCKICPPFLSTQSVCFPIKFPEYPSHSLPLALIDSGAARSLFDSELATALRIPLVPLKSPIPVRALDNRPIGTGLVHHIPVSLLTHDTHLEQITFLIIETPHAPRCFRSPLVELA